MKTFKFVLKCIFLPLAMVLILLVGAAGNYICLALCPTVIDGFFNNYDTSAEILDTIETDEEDWHKLAETIEGEGAVLLRNEDDALPLAGGAKINLLGYRAYDPVYGGTGSGMTDASSAITLKRGLEDAGFEVNDAVESVYTENNGNEGTIGFVTASYAINEVAPGNFEGEASFENLKEYSDIAVISIGRVGGEGSDLTQYEGPNGEHYLELSQEEKDLIETARDTFGTVIVLYNGANAMELGFLEEMDIDAALWVGDPGAYGFEAVGQILNGEINPSGRLTDTYAYDALSAPAMENYGNNTYTNISAFDSDDSEGNAHFVDYVEGIYVGYKWYETADAEGYFEKAGTSYEEVVQYPFGYGLSYTGFTQEISGGTKDGSDIDARGKITLDVTVTNIGEVAGKDVVEVYYTAPYTGYDQDAGIEKSAVNLIEYEKTDLLNPGESEELSVTIHMEDLASYDSTHDNGDGTKGCYMLDAGAYEISIRQDSHTVIETITVNLAEDYFFCGEQKRSSDEVVATNQFEAASRGVYLSRKDGFANYEEAMSSVSDVADEDTIYVVENSGTYDESYDDIDVTYEEGVDYRADGAKVDTNAENYVTLADMKGLDYDDPAWEQLLSQISLKEMQNMICYGGWRISGIDAIGSKSINIFDGPSGLTSMFSTGGGGTAYPATIVLASTWSKELSDTYGSYYADEYHAKGVSGCYAPSMNIHRSPFSGRNFEYYSEDGRLSALVGSGVAKASTDKGLLVYAKHFALNDQETNRGANICTWATEQTIREIYLSPFEKTVKDGNVTGMMAAFNRIGNTWCGKHKELLTNVLRGEWGFRGVVSTDAAGGDNYMTGGSDVTASVRAGCDIWLTFMGSDNKPSVETNADIHYVRRAAKDILYTAANGETIEINVKPWRAVLAVIDVVLVVLFLLCARGMVKTIKKRRQEKRQGAK